MLSNTSQIWVSSSKSEKINWYEKWKLNWNTHTLLAESWWYFSTLRIEKNPEIIPGIKKKKDIMRTRGALDWVKVKDAMASDSEGKTYSIGI